MENLHNIRWFGHASFSFVDVSGKIIYYIDPFDLKPEALDKADLIFITHAHPDHFSQNDIDKIITGNTLIIAPPDVLEKIDILNERKINVEPNKNYEIKGFGFSTIPAYNNNPSKLQFHPKKNNWVGYIFKINGQKIYHAGDTDFIEEMKSLKDLRLDAVLLPIGGGYTMDFEEAAKAADEIEAKFTIPMHYKRILGDKQSEAEEKFKNSVRNSKVIILKELK